MDRDYEAKEEIRETEISRVVNKLEATAEGLAKEVSSIESELSSVVNGGGLAKGVGAESPKPTEFSTDLASKINQLVENIKNSSNRLSTLRNRIEL